MGIDDVLARSREGVVRLGPAEVAEAAARGAIVVDTRAERQRREQGEFPGAIAIDRTVMEWRLDPKSDVVVCRQGYSSSLAAASMRALGLHRATDLVGGVEAWLDEGFPMASGPADVRLLLCPRPSGVDRSPERGWRPTVAS